MKKIKPKSKKSKADNSTVSAFINVQLCSLITYIVVFLIFSFVALAADLSRKYDYLFSVIIFVICSFLTGFYAGNKQRQNGLLTGIVYSLPMNTLTLLISLIFSDFKADSSIIITALLLVVSSAVGGILAVNKRHRR